jgi:hypothetical protein
MVIQIHSSYLQNENREGSAEATVQRRRLFESLLRATAISATRSTRSRYAVPSGSATANWRRIVEGFWLRKKGRSLADGDMQII